MRKKRISSTEEHTLLCCQYLQLGQVPNFHQGQAPTQFRECRVQLRVPMRSEAQTPWELSEGTGHAQPPNPWLLPSTRRWALSTQAAFPKGLLFSFPPTSSESFRSKPVRTHLIMQHESLHLNSHELGFYFKVSNFFRWTDFKDNIFKPVETQHHTGELHVFR